jgi:hypothetical protein
MSSLEFRSYINLTSFNFPITVANHFPGRWIGLRGPIECPQRNPGLAACDFCLWGWPKEPDRNQVHFSWNNEFEVFCRCFSHFISKSVESVFSRLQNVYKILGPLLESDSKWQCMGFNSVQDRSNVAVRVGDAVKQHYVCTFQLLCV